MASPWLTRVTLRRVVGATALLVYALDVAHVFEYVSSYYGAEDDAEAVLDDAEHLREDERILAAYESDCAEEALVTRKEFDERLAQLQLPGKDTGMYASLDAAGLKVNRESIAFGGAGRAAFMQLAHPFIAAGIRQHSQLENGVRTRFTRTFKYVFGMTFGTRDEVMSASKVVRGLHDRVTGTLNEDVGIFTRKSRFDAAQEHAMRWVAATLLETAVFEYEMHVAKLETAEKDQMVRDHAVLGMLFGIPPRADDPHTWAEFRKYMSAMWRSRLLTVSETAKDTATFLLLPPKPRYGPLLDLVWWSTMVQLPPRIAKQFMGRVPSWFDRLLFALFHGFVRFVYRLTPGHWRFLTAYWRMRDRVDGPRWIGARAVTAAAAAFSNAFLDMAMPPRDAEQTRAKVAEMRSKRVVFDKVVDSPIKVGRS